MDSNNLISSLVETYRDLNIRFRGAEDTKEARDIVRRMRDDEIAFSQALKDHLTGVGTADGVRNEIVDGDDRTLTQIISQFGTARATTLNLLKGMTDNNQWESPVEGGKSIRQHVEELIQSDQNQLQRLGEAVGV